jgi:adenylate kinase
MEILIITGPPYSGKGTQCEMLKSILAFSHISTGDYIRAEKNNKTPIGMIMSEYQAKGNFVPDAIMEELIEKIIDQHMQEKGIILDGYPRTIAQANSLKELFDKKGLKVKQVINIDVPENVLLERAANRAATSDRTDDKDPAIHFKRIALFESETRPTITHMSSQFPVVTINGQGSIEEIKQSIINNL